MVLIMREFYPSAIKADWEWCIIRIIIFSIPGLIATYKQGYSAEQIKLVNRPIRVFY